MACARPHPQPAPRVELIMIGTSTGGARALASLIAELPATLAVPIVIVLHIPPGYTHELARRLDRRSALRVVEVEDGMELLPGLVIVARGGMHAVVERDGLVLRARVRAWPVRSFTPSVDELFSSGAAVVGAGALGIILTGMGSDGLVGAQAIAAAGGALLTQSESTCVVYGMPRCVDDAGLGASSVPIDRMSEEITRRV